VKPGWFAHPVQSALIAGTWLLLQQSVAVPQLITAAVLALVLPRLLHGFTGSPRSPKAWGTAVRLFFVVLRDIVVSNVTVARLVLSPWARPQPAWVPVDLDIRDPRAVTLLATIITTTPGTVSCTVDEVAHRILVHALDGSAGAAAIAADIKARYEAPLKEIFE
jgi:multicomponent K+:H+ antiporter subunit E